MKHAQSPLAVFLTTAVLALCAKDACATQVRDLVRIKGHERNTLTGLGLVIGLDGTGDQSKDSLIAARPFAQLLENLGNPVANLDELAKADAYALVMVTLHVPPVGAREGDRCDVSVASMFNATSLAGGQLVVSMLRLPLPDGPDLQPLAVAEGMIINEGSNPRVGIIRDGGQLLADIRTHPVTSAGTMTLVLKEQYASYPVAATLAGAINDEFFIGQGYAELAIVEDARNIRVIVPASDRPEPADFIASLMTIPIDPSLIQSEARIVINEKRGIITITGNVEIGPVGITSQGLTISSLSAAPGGGGGSVGGGAWRGLDTTDGQSRSSTRLDELLTAFRQLNVPVEDQIAIIHELKKTGSLHAEIITE